MILSLFSQKPKDWYHSNFSNEERLQVERVFSPMGDFSAATIANSSEPHQLSTLADWFKKKDLRYLGYEFLKRGETLIEGHDRIVSVHLFYGAAGKFHYRWRNDDVGALDQSIQYFKKQIALSKEASKAFQNELDMVPRHFGFNQLRIIYEKQKKFDEAKSLCINALRDGWAGDWQKDIARIEKKQQT